MENLVDVEASAEEIDSQLQDVVSEVAYSMLHSGYVFDPKWKKKIEQARENGVQDIQGWLADELYNDLDTLSDFIGDKIHDAAHGDNAVMIKIAEEMKKSSHEALSASLEKFIKRHKNDK